MLAYDQKAQLHKHVRKFLIFKRKERTGCRTGKLKVKRERRRNRRKTNLITNQENKIIGESRNQNRRETKLIKVKNFYISLNTINVRNRRIKKSRMDMNVLT